MDSENPQSVAAAFLQGIKSGNPSTVRELLTQAAHKALDDSGLQPVVPGRTLAYFHVKSPLFLAKETKGVHLPCVWSESESQAAAEFVMVLRHEPQGWRVAGLVQSQGDDQNVIFNFESPFDLAACSATGAVCR